jgi:hypothetical protein
MPSHSRRAGPPQIVTNLAKAIMESRPEWVSFPDVFERDAKYTDPVGAVEGLEDVRAVMEQRALYLKPDVAGGHARSESTELFSVQPQLDPLQCRILLNKRFTLRQGPHEPPFLLRSQIWFRLDRATHRIAEYLESWEDEAAWTADHSAIPHWARELAIARQKAGFPVADMFKAWVENEKGEGGGEL